MEVKKENVLAAYETARKAGADSTMKVLEALFGEDTFKPKDIMERVKTFEDACRELGEEYPLVVIYRQVTNTEIEPLAPLLKNRDLIAYLKLRIICAALNEGWEPQFTEDEWRYYPWFWLYTQEEINDMDEDEKTNRRLMSTGDYQTGYAGLACADSSDAPSNTLSLIGSRLCLKSDTLAVYCGKQFINIWADYILIRK